MKTERDGMAAAAIAVERVAKSVRDGASEVRVLEDVSLTVEYGERLAIMGASGCGKSTLLHLMAGLDHPTRGVVRVDGRDLSALSEDQRAVLRRRRIGVVFQFFHLLPALTIEENVALPLLLDGQAGARVRARARHLLARVGLEARRSDQPATLSGGEMQRVAIARALVTEPAVVLADEPTGNLDPLTASAVLDLFLETERGASRALVIVTHDARVAARATRVVGLRAGRVVESGAGSEIAGHDCPAPAADRPTPPQALCCSPRSASASARAARASSWR